MEKFTIFTEPVYGDSVARSSDLEWDINFKGFSDNIEYDLTKLEDRFQDWSRKDLTTYNGKRSPQRSKEKDIELAVATTLAMRDKLRFLPQGFNWKKAKSFSIGNNEYINETIESIDIPTGYKFTIDPKVEYEELEIIKNAYGVDDEGNYQLLFIYKPKKKSMNITEKEKKGLQAVIDSPDIPNDIVGYAKRLLTKEEKVMPQEEKTYNSKLDMLFRVLDNKYNNQGYTLKELYDETISMQGSKDGALIFSEFVKRKKDSGDKRFIDEFNKTSFVENINTSKPQEEVDKSTVNLKKDNLEKINIENVLDNIKKGDTIKLSYDSSISKYNEANLKVRSRSTVKKGKVNETEKITFDNIKNPTGVKFYAYKRKGSIRWTFAIGDLAISNVKIEQEKVAETKKETKQTKENPITKKIKAFELLLTMATGSKKEMIEKKIKAFKLIENL